MLSRARRLLGKAVRRLTGRPAPAKPARPAKPPKPPKPKKQPKDYADRVARRQREGDEHLWLYWNVWEEPRFRRVSAAVDAIATARGKRDLAIFDFGCASGALLRRLDADLGDRFELALTGSDVEHRSLEFLRERMPKVRTIDADFAELQRLDFATQNRFDVCISTCVLLLLREEEARGVLGDFARMSDAIVLVDEFGNFEGQAPVTIDRAGANGEYRARCLPLATWLRELGFTEIVIEQLPDNKKGATGFIVATRRPLAASA